MIVRRLFSFKFCFWSVIAFTRSSQVIVISLYDALAVWRVLDYSLGDAETLALCWVIECFAAVFHVDSEALNASRGGWWLAIYARWWLGGYIEGRSTHLMPPLAAKWQSQDSSRGVVAAWQSAMHAADEKDLRVWIVHEIERNILNAEASLLQKNEDALFIRSCLRAHLITGAFANGHAVYCEFTTLKHHQNIKNIRTIRLQKISWFTFFHRHYHNT